VVALCALDPLTQVDHSATTVTMPDDGVLVVDSVFALRPQLDDAWDLRVWVDVDAELSVSRSVVRDSHQNGPEEAEALHRGRYLVGEMLYLVEVDPIARADVVVDNRDLDHPVLVRGA
jgi:uridine kinase